jgi:hypothetical protein
MNLKPLVNDKTLWDALCVELNQRIEFAHKQLELRTELEEVYRLQGEIKALRSLLQLRDKTNGPERSVF